MMRSPDGATGLVIPGGTFLSTVDAGGATKRCGVGPCVSSTVTSAAVDAPVRNHGRFDFQSFTRHAPSLGDHAAGAATAGRCPVGTIRLDEGQASTSRGASGSGHRGGPSCAGPSVYAKILIDERIEHWQQCFHDMSPLGTAAGGAALPCNGRAILSRSFIVDGFAELKAHMEAVAHGVDRDDEDGVRRRTGFLQAAPMDPSDSQPTAHGGGQGLLRKVASVCLDLKRIRNGRAGSEQPERVAGGSLPGQWQGGGTPESRRRQP